MNLNIESTRPFKICEGCYCCKSKCKNIVHERLSDKYCYIHSIMIADYEKNEKNLILQNEKNCV